jgi:hypothetical protein
MTEIPIEAMPVASGVLLGLLCWRLVSGRPGLPATICLSLPTGALITYLAGELELSWAFVVFDVGQVVLASLATRALLQARARREPRAARAGSRRR